jgi:hypothetical protein
MSGLGDVTFYNDDVTVGMVMKTVTLTDADPEDVASLSLTIQSIDNGGTTYLILLPNMIYLFNYTEYYYGLTRYCFLWSIKPHVDFYTIL